MTDLTYLALGRNDITGTLPTQLGLIVGATDFELEENSISGTIPTQLGQLSGPENVFGLQENLLTSTIPTQLGLMYELEEKFYLESNQLCADIPPEVLALSSHLTHWKVTTGNDIGTVRNVGRAVET